VRFWLVVLGMAAFSMSVRAAGPLVFAKRRLPEWALGPFALLTPVVLGALMVVGTFSAGRSLVLDPRAAGVGAAAICALLRAPLLVTMVAAAAVTGLVRLVV
jgi:hypothetical protein